MQDVIPLYVLHHYREHAIVRQPLGNTVVHTLQDVQEVVVIGNVSQVLLIIGIHQGKIAVAAGFLILAAGIRQHRPIRRTRHRVLESNAVKLVDLVEPRRITHVNPAFLRTTGAPALVILNAIAPTGQDAMLAEEALSSHDVETCPVRLGRRVAFERALLSGQSAQEYEPFGKAAREIAELHTFVLARLQDFKPSINENRLT